MFEPHATILIHAHPPLTAAHAAEHIQRVKRHRAPRGTVIERDDNAWKIENKYYTADVGFKVLDLGKETGDEEAPAVIVLAQRDIPPSTLSPVLSRLSSRPTEIDVALLVSIAPSPPTLTSEPSAAIDEDAWEDVALEHGFEWIDAPNYQDEDQDETGTPDEPNGRDDLVEPEGVARVVAALHANMWEGMVPVAKEQKESRPKQVGELVEEEIVHSGEDELGGELLGAPPLPEPRPFIPIQLDFPTTFLPSVLRKSSPLATNSTPSLASAPLDFQDDFAPFVPPSSGATFPPLPTTLDAAEPPATIQELYRHPELAFPDTEALEVDEDEDDGLDDLFAKLKGFREEASGMDMEERRKLAEAVVEGLGLLD